MLAITALKPLLLPPAFQLLLLFAAYLSWRGAPRVGRACLLVAVLSLWVLSLPAVTSLLYKPLEKAYYSAPDITALKPQAIVILGAGRYRNAPEYAGDTVSSAGLVRLRYGAKLARAHDLPILLSGGNVLPFDEAAEAELAARVLTTALAGEFRLWLEPHSRNTWENAYFSAQVLSQYKITRIVLVTQAFHMRRAARAFDLQGLDVVPGATDFYSFPRRSGWNDWLPSAKALFDSSRALNEYIGLLYYEMKYNWLLPSASSV